MHIPYFNKKIHFTPKGKMKIARRKYTMPNVLEAPEVLQETQG
jgi:hypothetical protein